jgi:hypothetical protein
LKKLLATALALVLLAALAIGVGSLAWRPGTRAGPPRLEGVAAGAGALSAGAAQVEIALPQGVAIGGFPRLRWGSTGVRDPVHVRALVLSEPGVSIALVSVEILLVPGPLARAVLDQVEDLGLDHVVLGATHTHAGPGGYWRDPIAERAALGPYDPPFAEALAARIAEAIRAAAAARGPATVASGSASSERLARNRAGGEVDGRLVTLRVARPGGEPVAEVVVFPAHPTLLGSSNERISGDWPGAFAGASQVPLLFFQGALGDQSARPPPGRDALDRYARRVGMAVDRVRLGAPSAAPALAVATATAVLPPPALGATPPLLKRVTRNLLYGLFPDRTRVAAVRIGALRLLAVPAEPVTEVGRRWREQAGPGTEILSLANDYLGYVETESRMAERDGETVRTYFGPELASRLGDALLLASAEADRSVAALEAEASRTAAAPPDDQNRTAGAPASVNER